MWKFHFYFLVFIFLKKTESKDLKTLKVSSHESRIPSYKWIRFFNFQPNPTQNKSITHIKCFHFLGSIWARIARLVHDHWALLCEDLWRSLHHHSEIAVTVRVWRGAFLENCELPLSAWIERDFEHTIPFQRCRIDQRSCVVDNCHLARCARVFLLNLSHFAVAAKKRMSIL